MFSERIVFRKIKNKKLNLTVIAILTFIFILALFGEFNIYSSRKIINNQARNNLILLTDSIKNDVDDYFRGTEEAVEHCRKVIELTFDYNKANKIRPIVYRYNKNKIPYIQNYLDSIVSPMLLYSSQKIERLSSIYFMFDPKFLANKELVGVWYLKKDDKLKSIDNGLTSTMYPENRSDLEWFYLPKKLKKGIWTKPYRDDDLKINMVTYSTPVYSNNTFLGIAGIDLAIDQLEDFLFKFKVYKTGNIYLINQDREIIFAKNYKTGTPIDSIDKNLDDCLNGHCQKKFIKTTSEDVKIIKSVTYNKLFSITNLNNGFFLVIEVSKNELYWETNKLVVLSLLLLMLAIIISLFIAIKAYSKIKNINNELIHKEKLISIGTMSAGIAHEINNPLGYINCNIDTLKKFLEKIRTFMLSCKTGFGKVVDEQITFEDQLKYIENLKSELKIDYVLNEIDGIIDETKDGINKVSEIVLNLKNFAKNDSQNIKSEQNLSDIFEESLTILNNKLKNNVEVVKVFGDIPPLYCNKNQLKQVFINMIDNAYQALLEKEILDKKITVTTYKKGHNACIEIADNGIGIEKNKLNKIFDAFFTTKAQGEGTGLGLSIVYDIVTNKHSGEILVESKKGKGTTFTIRIPYQKSYK